MEVLILNGSAKKSGEVAGIFKEYVESSLQGFSLLPIQS